MTDTSVLEPAGYLRRLFDDVEFCYLVVVAAQLGVADLVHLAHGRSPISLRPLLPMPSRSTVSCGRLQAEGCFGKTTTSGSHLRRWRSRCAGTPLIAFSRSSTPANPLLRLPYTTRLHSSLEKVTK